MAKDPLLPDSPREGDSWESLASNLFGVDLNQPAEAETVSPEELDFLEAELQEAETSAAAAGGDERAETEAADSSRDDSSTEPVSSASDSAAKSAADEGSAEQTPADKANDKATDEADEEDNPYWDPLAAWQWDEEEVEEVAEEEETVITAEADSAAAGPSPPAEVSHKTVEAVPEVAETEEEDWDFGAGLLEEVTPPPPRTGRAASPAGRSAPAAPSPAPPVSPAEKTEEKTERAERAEKRVPQKKKETASHRRPAAEETEDDFGAGLVEDILAAETETSPAETPAAGTGETAPAGESRRSGRRGRRRTERIRSEEQSPEKARDANEAAVSPDQKADKDVPDKDAEEKGARYRNIPSWETAISYLVRRPSSGEARKSRADGEEKTGSSSGRRSRGGQRRRRRR